MKKKFAKGQFVTYSAGHLRVGRLLIEAIVRTVHRDSTVTVEARHFLKRGKPSGGYLGYKYRLPASSLKPRVVK